MYMIDHQEPGICEDQKSQMVPGCLGPVTHVPTHGQFDIGGSHHHASRQDKVGHYHRDPLKGQGCEGLVLQVADF